METSPPLPTAAELREELRGRIFRHFVPCTTEVLGCRLQPFSLWHWRTLDVLQNCFAPDSLSPLWRDDDLAVAVWICSLPVGDAAAFAMPTGTRQKLLFQLGKEKHLLPAHAAALSSHIADACAGPARWQKPGGSPVHCPVWLYLTASLIRRGWTEPQAWAKTPGEARNWLAALDVAEGGPDYLSEQEVVTALESGYTMEDIGLG